MTGKFAVIKPPYMPCLLWGDARDCEKIPFPTILKDAHLFCKETTNQPQPQGLNPNQQAKVTAWHTKPCKPIQRTPKTDAFLE